ncbi:MAG: glutaredoxin 3 [Candidatus Binatota bacterium]|jgi:glutaredoxin 3|nr:glutaredoxin 3 [Candidatus Binatota bacterium]
MAAPVKVYTTIYCTYCRQAKALLERKGVEFEEVDVTTDSDSRDWLVRTTGRRTVPQVFIGEQPVGGYDELRELERSGELDQLLQA